MANEKRLIDANAFSNEWWLAKFVEYKGRLRLVDTKLLRDIPTVDAVEVVRCQNCVHAEPLDHNCELSTSYYLHCKLWRGEETKNVWHKYKKYYKDYSLVERDGFCSDGAKMDGDGNGVELRRTNNA